MNIRNTVIRLIGLGLIAASITGCDNPLLAHRFKIYTTNADTVQFADVMLQQCWDDALLEVKQTSTPLAPLPFYSVAQVKVLNCQDSGVTDASDLYKAGGALSIDLSGNELGTLDLGYMPALDELFAIYSGLDTLNVSQAGGLETLDVGYNSGITELDLSSNDLLLRVDLTLSKITNADITNKQDLWFVSLAGAPLETLDISGNPSLEVVSLLDADRNLDQASLDALDTLDAENPGLCIYIYPYEDTDCDGLDLPEEL